MTSDVQAPPPPPAEHERSMSPVQRLGGVLFSPDETFRDIARKPDILLPLAVLFIVSVISAALIIPRMDFETMIRDQMERSGRTANLAPGDVDRAVRIGASFAKVVGYASPAVSIGVWAIIALVLMLSYRMFGGEGTYKQAFAVTLYAWMPLIIKSIIGTVVAMTRSNVDPETINTLVASNPAILVDVKLHPVLFSLLTSIDLFSIWTIVLFIISFAYVSRMSKTASAITVLCWWGVVTFFKVGFAAFGAMRMKAGA